jgi:uncharacterized membrane protein
MDGPVHDPAKHPQHESLVVSFTPALGRRSIQSERPPVRPPLAAGERAGGQAGGHTCRRAGGRAGERAGGVRAGGRAGGRVGGHLILAVGLLHGFESGLSFAYLWLSAVTFLLIFKAFP